MAVTVLLVPTFLSAKVALAAEQVTLPVSPARTPVSVQLAIVAAVEPSYVLLSAVMLAVTDFWLTVRLALPPLAP